MATLRADARPRSAPVVFALAAVVVAIACATVSAQEDDDMDVMEEVRAEAKRESQKEAAAAAGDDLAPSAKGTGTGTTRRQRVDHPLTDIPPPAKGAEASCIILGDPERRFVVGKEISTLGVLSNGGSNIIHVWGIMGSLNDAQTFGKYLQNFSYALVNRSLSPGEETSFAYSFAPYERLEATKYRVAITVFYEEYAMQPGAGGIYGANIVFNETITLVESMTGVDNRLFYLVVIVVAVLVLVVILSYRFIAAQLRKRARAASAAAPVETGTREVAKNEWLEEHNKIRASAGIVKRHVAKFENNSG